MILLLRGAKRNHRRFGSLAAVWQRPTRTAWRQRCNPGWQWQHASRSGAPWVPMDAGSAKLLQRGTRGHADSPSVKLCPAVSIPRARLMRWLRRPAYVACIVLHRGRKRKKAVYSTCQACNPLNACVFKLLPPVIFVSSRWVGIQTPDGQRG